MPRTSGPYATLDAARSAAGSERERRDEASPLAARIAAGTARRRGGTGLVGKEPAGPPASRRPPRRAPASWLDRLAERDREAAAHARRLIGALERLGLEDAEAVVRREVEAGLPSVAGRLLALAIARALAGLPDGAAPGKPSHAPATQSLSAVLSAIEAGRVGRSDRILPGWRLVEWRDGQAGRELRLTTDDVVAAMVSARAEAEGRADR